MAGETILIIDDNADVRVLLGERVLPSYGYRTLTAPDGQEGLWQIRTHKPDLILLDLRLPDMTGLDLLHILSSEGYDTPVILITAYGSELIAAQALRLGVHDYIIKPFTLDEIVESVERALTEQRLRRERNALTDRLRYCTTALRLLAETRPETTRPEDSYAQLCRLLEMAVAATRSRKGRLWLYEPREGALSLQVAQDQADQRAYLLQQSEGTPHQVEQAFASGELQQWGENAEPKESNLATPILQAGRPVGVLEVHLPEETLPQNGAGLLVLQAFAEAIGTALEWSHLRRQNNALERRIEVLGTLSQDVLLVLNEQDVITAVTPSAAAMLGQNPAEAIGRNFQEWIQGIESPEGEVVEWYNRQVSEAQPTERYAFSFQGAQGEPRQAEVQVVSQQEPEGILCRYLLFHEVTTYNRMEQQVRSLRHTLSEFMRGSHLGLFLTDLKGTVVAINGVLTDVLKLTPERVLGRLLWEAFAPSEGGHLLPEEIARACRQGSSYAEVSWPERGSGSLGVTSLLLLGPEGAPHAIAVLVGPPQTAIIG